MSKLHRFLLTHALIGFGIAILFVGMIFAFDLAGLGSLILRSDVEALAIFMLVYFMGLTFASVQMAFALLLASKDVADDGRGGGGGRLTAFLQALAYPGREPAPVRHTAR
ncbi:MAG: hypothetical protein AAGL24_16230 [Pseudomonadota bacterium]